MIHKHHIIPLHMGGTNDPSNIIEVSVEEHAELHRRLYEAFGCWQDKLAWHGLSGRIGKEEIIRERSRQGALDNPHCQKAATIAAAKANKGKKQSAKHVAKKAASKQRSIEIDGILYESGVAASKALGVRTSTISGWAKKNGSRVGISIPTGSNQYIQR